MYMAPIHVCENANPWLVRAAIEIAKRSDVVEIAVTKHAIVTNGSWNVKSKDVMETKMLRYAMARETDTTNNRPPGGLSFTFLGPTQANAELPGYRDGIHVAYVGDRNMALAEAAKLYHSK